MDLAARKRMAFALGWFSLVFILGAILRDNSDEVWWCLLPAEGGIYIEMRV